MIPSIKIAICLGAVALLAGGYGIFGYAQEKPVEVQKTPIEAKMDASSDLYKNERPEVQAVMDAVKAYDKQKEANTITGREQEILDLETHVDELRREHDTPLLQKLDRMLETMDADKQWYDAEVQKMLDL